MKARPKPTGETRRRRWPGHPERVLANLAPRMLEVGGRVTALTTEDGMANEGQEFKPLMQAAACVIVLVFAVLSYAYYRESVVVGALVFAGLVALLVQRPALLRRARKNIDGAIASASIFGGWRRAAWKVYGTAAGATLLCLCLAVASWISFLHRNDEIFAAARAALVSEARDKLSVVRSALERLKNAGPWRSGCSGQSQGHGIQAYCPPR